MGFWLNPSEYLKKNEKKKIQFPSVFFKNWFFKIQFSHVSTFIAFKSSLSPWKCVRGISPGRHRWPWCCFSSFGKNNLLPGSGACCWVRLVRLSVFHAGRQKTPELHKAKRRALEEKSSCFCNRRRHLRNTQPHTTHSAHTQIWIANESNYTAKLLGYLASYFSPSCQVIRQISLSCPFFFSGGIFFFCMAPEIPGFLQHELEYTHIQARFRCLPIAWGTRQRYLLYTPV